MNKQPAPSSEEGNQEWTRVITPTRGILAIPVREIWGYRDLLLLLVRRDFVAQFKQTILGPLWFIIQPLLMTLVFTIVFGNIANLSTDGLPQVLFYLSGVTLWTYFSETMTTTSDTFIVNSNVFGKVYFPRIIVPMSVVISNLMKFFVQFATFLLFLAWYAVSDDTVQPNWTVIFLPLLLLQMGMLGLGLGMIISALTTKYRDLRFMMTFGVRLLMYATPVIYPVSAIPQDYKLLILANPITPIVEVFRYSFLGRGTFEPIHLVYSVVVTLVLFSLALVIFNQVEKNFMDTV